MPNGDEKNIDVLKNTLKETAKIGMKLGLIDGTTLFIDGSQIRGNASFSNSWTPERAEETLKKIDTRISEVLKECDEVDKSEEGSASLVKLNDELKSKEKLKSKVENIITELKESKNKSHNTTDQDAVKLNGVHGICAGYSVQSVVDEKCGLIVSVDAVSQSNDYNQLRPQIENAREVLGKCCEVVCADAGYASLDDLVKVDAKGIKVVVPSARQVNEEKNDIPEYSIVNFKYDKDKDCYTCPEGKELNRSSINNRRKRVRYKADKSVCNACKFLTECTTSKNGRAS